jgi:hypothetical protein
MFFSEMFGGINVEHLHNLRILSKLEPGDRLCTQQHPFVIISDANWSMSSARRWLAGESRMQNIDAIMSLVTSCITYGMGLDVKVELLRASRGLSSLIETYQDDRTAISALEIVLDLIRRSCRDDEHSEAIFDEDYGMD